MVKGGRTLPTPGELQTFRNIAGTQTGDPIEFLRVVNANPQLLQKIRRTPGGGEFLKRLAAIQVDPGGGLISTKVREQLQRTLTEEEAERQVIQREELGFREAKERAREEARTVQVTRPERIGQLTQKDKKKLGLVSDVSLPAGLKVGDKVTQVVDGQTVTFTRIAAGFKAESEGKSVRVGAPKPIKTVPSPRRGLRRAQAVSIPGLDEPVVSPRQFLLEGDTELILERRDERRDTSATDPDRFGLREIRPVIDEGTFAKINRVISTAIQRSTPAPSELSRFDIALASGFGVPLPRQQLESIQQEPTRVAISAVVGATGPSALRFIGRVAPKGATLTRGAVAAGGAVFIAGLGAEIARSQKKSETIARIIARDVIPFASGAAARGRIGTFSTTVGANIQAAVSRTIRNIPTARVTIDVSRISRLQAGEIQKLNVRSFRFLEKVSREGVLQRRPLAVTTLISSAGRVSAASRRVSEIRSGALGRFLTRVQKQAGVSQPEVVGITPRGGLLPTQPRLRLAEKSFVERIFKATRSGSIERIKGAGFRIETIFRGGKLQRQIFVGDKLLAEIRDVGRVQTTFRRRRKAPTILKDVGEEVNKAARQVTILSRPAIATQRQVAVAVKTPTLAEIFGRRIIGRRRFVEVEQQAQISRLSQRIQREVTQRQRTITSPLVGISSLLSSISKSVTSQVASQTQGATVQPAQLTRAIQAVTQEPRLRVITTPALAFGQPDIFVRTPRGADPFRARTPRRRQARIPPPPPPKTPGIKLPKFKGTTQTLNIPPLPTSQFLEQFTPTVAALSLGIRSPTREFGLRGFTLRPIPTRP